MRAFCTVSAPLEVCAPPTRPLLPGSRFLALRLLGIAQPRTLYFLVEAKSRVREVYAQTCVHFAKQGMLDTELFGLAVLIDGEYLFADPESKLSKYGPKSWRSSHTHGLDANGRPLLELHFRVQFYVESPLMLRDESSRHNYYLQLKANAISRDVPKECSEQSLILLGGLALQADFGDCPDDPPSPSSPSPSPASSSSTTTAATSAATNTSPLSATAPATSTKSQTPTTTSTDYFRIEDYIPSQMQSSWGTTALQSCHREYRGMSRADAETHYIREACALQEALSAHVFRMKLSKNENGPGSVWFIVYAKGIKVYGDNYPATTFLWPNITKLSFERKKFEIRYGENKTVLYSTSDDKNKILFFLCKETHQFSMKIASRLNEAIRREEEENSSLHACYMYSRSLNLPYKNKSDQRISVISSTSSNTTSGIVSDRVHSEDELEIMINCPPAIPIAAPSTESLALAHLLDKPSVSRQTSSVGRVSHKELEDSLAALSVTAIAPKPRRSLNSTPEAQLKLNGIANKDHTAKTSESSDSPSSQNNIGSQCSSTCSTVVVATDTLAMPPIPIKRRPSTSSSLELGFSHTAQNSSLSETLDSAATDLEYVSASQGDEEESMSGVYTLAHPAPTETSGVYTMSNSELTGQSSEMAESESQESSYYGSFQPKSEIGDHNLVENIDSVDGNFRKRMDSSTGVRGFRMRSDSNISTSGSFRGDGSDPTDKKHALLSAEELTDLIVGRGTYPSRKTVSDTLDSDCDYVTLPLPLKGDSYLQGNQDTAPTEDCFEDDLLPSNPPAPPIRVDSNSHRSFTGMMNNRTKLLPPPYNARHETTGLCGPPVCEDLPVIPLRDPPPYPQQPIVRQTPVHPPPPPPPLTPSPIAISNVGLPEEATARFITTKPQINILKAHASIIGDNPKPSFAAPTISNVTSQSSSPIIQPHVPTPSSIGIPIVPYHNIHTSTHKSISTTVPAPPPPYPDVKQKPTPRTCVLLPVIKPRHYLPPPPPTLPRQPPPPPPPQLATVYTSQLARSQIELYQQQLYSDVDYVIYPLQDPAISQQEYLDAKQGSLLAAMAQSPPPPPYLAYHTASSHHGTWGDACKTHTIYRSTPYLSMAYSTHSRYASTQNLSDTYVQLPGAYSPMYSPSVASLCSSYEPPPPPPLRPRPASSIKTNANLTTAIFSRSKSDDNILNSIETTPKMRRLPPPPPPPYDFRKPIRTSMVAPPIMPKLSAIIPPALPKPPMPSPPLKNAQPSSPLIPLTAIKQISDDATPSTVLAQQQQTIDINTLREKSKHLDLPLISALCNDRSLLKQTKAFVMPKHPRSLIMSGNSNNSIGMQQCPSVVSSPKGKYPVSGLSTTQLAKPRKTSISHRHPNDKLPPLPMHTAEGNNYVMDPTPTSIKHKSFNSQPHS